VQPAAAVSSPRDDLPLPPARLRHLVAGTGDADWFLTGGQQAAESIRAAVAAVGRSLESLGSVLDWGCGCGRVIRHFNDTPGTRFFGSDCNAELIDWSRQAYPHATFALNGLLPPLPFEDASFDLVYGLSVVTHLPHDMLSAWMTELGRVLRPDGLALLTTHGSHYLNMLSEEEVAQFLAGQLVVRYGAEAGSNACSTFCSESYVRNELAAAHGFEVVYFEPEGGRGNPFQDLYLLQKATLSAAAPSDTGVRAAAAASPGMVTGAAASKAGAACAPAPSAAERLNALMDSLTPRALRRLRQSLSWALGDARGMHGVPPARLRMKVHGSLDVPSFLAVGESCAHSLFAALERTGSVLRQDAAVLDFGCGVGRTLMPWRRLMPEVRLFGTDIDAEAIGWCRQNLQGGVFAINSAEPPLPYDADQFDLIYAVSVFTHLDEAMQFRWLQELHRVAKPGAVLLLSVHGPSCAHILPPDCQPEYARRGFCYTRSDIWSAFFPDFYHTAVHSREYVQAEWTKHFEVVAYLDRGLAGHQDLVVLRRSRGRAASTSLPRVSEVQPVPRAALVQAMYVPAAAGHIERLRWEGAGHPLSLSGWLTLPGQRLEAVEVRVDGRSVGRVAPRERPDVQQALPRLPGARNSGFLLSEAAVPASAARWLHVEVIGHTSDGPAGSIETLYHPAAPAALPIPPAEFSRRVDNSDDPEFYRIGALRSFTAYLSAIRRHAPEPESSLRLLDWGAGCGRLTAAWARLADLGEVHACDIDPQTTGWARDILAGEAEFRVIEPYPPTPYEAGMFDVIVANSVMTHLDRDTQRKWLHEMRRVLRPGGLFMASVHGAFAAGAVFDVTTHAGLLTQGIHDTTPDPALNGIAPEGYYRGTFQTLDYTIREWGSVFAVLEYRERGVNNWQDLVVMRAPVAAE
jgi:SAM-dependent methyltransferase